MGVALKLEEMSIADKLQTMEILWNDLCHHAQDIAVPQWHQEVLAMREADLRDGKEQFSDWESAKETIHELVK